MSDYDDGSDYKPNFGPDRDQPPPPPPPPPMATGVPLPNTQDSYSVAALITGILALLLGLFCGILAIPVGIVAIYLGVQGRKRSASIGKPTGIATAGLAMGAVAMVVSVAFIGVALVMGIGGS